MKASRYTEAQILGILRQTEGGMPVAELCRAHGIELGVVLQMSGEVWGMDSSMMDQLKVLEDENRRFKRMYADLSMQAELLKETLGKCMVRSAIARFSWVTDRLA